MKLFVINTGNLMLDGGAMFGVVPKVIWSRYYPADENNLCNWSMRCLLIETEGRRILIDNGIGDKQPEKFTSLYHLNGNDTLEKSLNNNGFRYNDITDVVLTHLHFDHCGGSVTWNETHTAYRTTFPNARYWVSRQQWECAVNPNKREKASFLKENIFPLQESGQLYFIETDHQLCNGVFLKLFFGHTDGQIVPFINYGKKTIVFMADLLPSAAHIPLAWVMSYDTRPLVTLEEKELFLKKAAAENYILFLEHDLFNECCTVIETDKGIRLSEVFPLAQELNT